MRQLPTTVQAPGKLVLLGEYAVRHGAPALAVALDRRVTVRVGGVPAGDDLPNRARQLAAALLELELRPAPCRADSRQLYLKGCKLGLGSSAAVVVAAVASLLVEQGRDLDGTKDRREVFRLSRRVHDQCQSCRGSGIDVAASTFGGYLVLENRPGDSSRVRQWRPPAGWYLSFWWTGHDSSTPERIAMVDDFARRQGAVHERLMADMTDTCRRFLAAAGIAECCRWLECYRRQLLELGRRSGLEMMSSGELELARRARELGGVLKPAGAGGGDCLLAVFPTGEQQQRFARLARQRGLVAMAAAVDRRGVRRLPPEAGHG